MVVIKKRTFFNQHILLKRFSASYKTNAVHAAIEFSYKWPLSKTLWLFYFLIALEIFDSVKLSREETSTTDRLKIRLFEFLLTPINTVSLSVMSAAPEMRVYPRVLTPHSPQARLCEETNSMLTLNR